MFSELHVPAAMKFYHFTIYHVFLSLHKEEPLSELSPQTPVSGYYWPHVTQVTDEAIPPSCFRP